MANYNTQFSVAIPMPSSVAVDSAIRAHLYLRDNEPFLAEGSCPKLFRRFIAPEDGWAHSLVQLNIADLQDTNDLLVSDFAGEGDIDAAVKFVEYLFDRWKLTEPVVIHYSCSCSRPRIDAFTGGAVVVWRGEGGHPAHMRFDPFTTANDYAEMLKRKAKA